MNKLTFGCLVFLLSCGADDGSGPTGPRPPARPANTLAVAGQGEIGLEWRDVDYETHYEIQYRPAYLQTWANLRDVSANSTSARHASVEKNVTYQYRVAACNTVG